MKSSRKKRRLHIANAQYALLHSHSAAPGVDFTYDTIYLLDALAEHRRLCLRLQHENRAFRYPQAMVDEFDLPGRVIVNAAAV